ncbi:hypothetical protein GALL_109160 [mine drainage metagenome]|uniref:Spore protein YkvP/CgeB glycosyl transferase-like domain-containing protein n=1 Tax=mine drainage metagenome TaxID=410659 RepID=A0A1J5SEZ7_9ZZZZ
MKEFLFGYPVTYAQVDIRNKDQYDKLICKLLQRGIVWPLDSSINNHIVYASYPSSWEEINIPQELNKISNDISCYFLKDRDIKLSNKRILNKFIDQDFYEWVSQLNKKKKISAILTYFSGAEISPKTISKIRSLGIPIFTFHLDDRLHFFGRLIGMHFSGPVRVCNMYDLNLSSSIYSLKQYAFFKSLVLYWPEGVNPNYFKPREYPKFKYDVVFIGRKYGDREALIKYLRGKGIQIKCFGYGWEETGSISNDEYVEIINSSKVVLGLGYISFTRFQTLKGRDFEVPSCGAVYITSFNKEIENQFVIGKEIFTYNNWEECGKYIKMILHNPEIANEVRKNARTAVLNKHSWEIRFRKLFFNEG